MSNKTKTQGVAIGPELKRAAKAAAKRDQRSLSSYIRSLIERDLRNQKAA